MSDKPFHLKYRPRTLKSVIGHESVVTRLQGIIKSNKVPNALMFVGNSSVGKTTLARCFANDLNGTKNVEELRGDYKELNGTEQRTMEDIRAVIKLSMYKPSHKKRIIVIDEFQGVLSTPASAGALLKPLEEPSKDTIWILCTMDPSKLGTGNGKAIANRCTQFVLNPPSREDLRKQAIRIIKKEDMSYCKDIIDTLIDHSNYEFRTLANLAQSLNQYYEGLDSKPKRLQEKDISSILSTVTDSDDKLAVECLVGIYNKKYKQAYKALLNVTDYYRFISTLISGNQYLLTSAVLEGKGHSKLQWYLKTNKDLEAKVKNLKLTLGVLAQVNESLVDLKSIASNFAVDAQSLISARLYRLIKSMP